MFYVFLFGLISCKELVHNEAINKIKIFKEIETPQLETKLMLRENKIIKNLTGRGAAISLLLFHHNVLDGTSNHICHHVNQDFKTLYPLYIDVLQNENLTENQIENMIHISDGVFILDSKLNGYIYQFYYKNFTEKKIELKMKFSMKEKWIQKESQFIQKILLAYNPKSHTIYVIFINEIIIIDIDLNQPGVLQGISSIKTQFTTLQSAASSSVFLFIADQKQITVFYMNKENGDLNLRGLITVKDIYPFQNTVSLDITDIIVGGKESQFLYVLDKLAGVSILVIDTLISENELPGINIILNKDVGLIHVQNGFKMDQYNDESLIVLTEGVGEKRRHNAIEFAINLAEGYWMKVTSYDLKGKASDIDITQSIAILRGVDSHKVIFHSIFDGFKNKQIESSEFYLPQMKQIDLFEPNYGKENQKWHYNQHHEFIFGVNRNQLFFFMWEEIEPGIECATFDPSDQNNVYIYTLTANTSWCDSKRSYLKNTLNAIPDLIMCMYELNFTVQVEGVLFETNTEKDWFLIMIILAGLLILALAGMLRVYYINYSTRKIELERELKGFLYNSEKNKDLMTNPTVQSTKNQDQKNYEIPADQENL